MQPFDSVLQEFQIALSDCQRVYLDAARDCGVYHPHLLDCTPNDFVARMRDLHIGLLSKIFFTVTQGRWGRDSCEQRLAQVLFRHLWNRNLNSRDLDVAAPQVHRQAQALHWESLLAPFAKLPPLADRRGNLATVIMRVANLTAKSDGLISADEQQRLREVEQGAWRSLRPNPPTRSSDQHVLGGDTSQQTAAQTTDFSSLNIGEPAAAESPTPSAPKSPEQTLQAALDELDGLIGLDSTKSEVRTLTNYLKLQQHRRDMGLPNTPLSLHMVFVGNPGTGKTTVARIIAKIFGALGVLKKGHLVETDRSGLVAKFAGQTAPLTQKRIDEALDGVLFIDEAYSLAGGNDEDAYGREAVQTLLKRMEDDRERLAVILAGYPREMEDMLRSNPGLSSRFGNTLTFDDYKPHELAAIFQRMCDANHYRIRWKGRMRLLLGLQWLHEHRDEHFGNGREVRNLFERAVRRLADRVAEIAPITREILTRLRPEDFEFPAAADASLAGYDLPDRRVVIRCPHCQATAKIVARHLGRTFPCPHCQEHFEADWGESIDPPPVQ